MTRLLVKLAPLAAVAVLLVNSGASASGPAMPLPGTSQGAGPAISMYGNDSYGAVEPPGTALHAAMPTPVPLVQAPSPAAPTQLGTGFSTTFPFGSTFGQPDTAAAFR